MPTNVIHAIAAPSADPDHLHPVAEDSSLSHPGQVGYTITDLTQNKQISELVSYPAFTAASVEWIDEITVYPIVSTGPQFPAHDGIAFRVPLGRQPIRLFSVGSSNTGRPTPPVTS